MTPNPLKPYEVVGYGFMRAGIAPANVTRACVACVQTSENGLSGGVALMRKDMAQDARCSVCGWRMAGPTA